MLFPALVILPGLIGIAIYQAGDHFLPFVDNDPSKGIDYNMTIPMLLARYFPTGMLGIGFTALMASFMSGMAGNVTAFNTVWTYDIYQSYIGPGKSDKHYLWMGRWATVAGIFISVGTAYWASKSGNIMNLLQLVFSFVNAPLFATFLLGMFWRRTTGHGAFFGLLGGTLGAAVFHGISLVQGATPGMNGGWLFLIGSTAPWLLLAWSLFLCVFGTALVHMAGVEHSDSAAKQAQIGRFLLKVLCPVLAVFSLVLTGRPSSPAAFHSAMGQNFWIAIVAWTTCFLLTILISLATARNKTDEQLKGLVYSLTPKPETAHEPWYKQPVTVGILVLIATVVLNIIFW
jgi:Na+/proline symporter